MTIKIQIPMKMMPKYVSILCFTLFAYSYGQQSAPWTLEAAVEHAVKNNLQIRAAYLDVMDAETYKSQAVGNFLPSLNLSAGHSWNIGLNRNLTTNLLEDLTNQFSSGGLDMSLVIYNGRRNVYQLMSANLGVLARQYQLEDMKEDVMLLVVNGFLQVLFNKENLAVQNNLLEVAKAELLQTETLVDAGVLPKGELFELQATLASQEQQAVAASNNYEIARISLAQLLLIDDYKNFSIAETNYDMVAATILDKSPKELFQKAVESRNDIMLAKTNVEIAQTNLKTAKSAYQPTLSGYYGYSSRISYADRLVATGTYSTYPIGVVSGTGQQVLAASPDTEVAKHLPLGDQWRQNDGHNFGFNLRIPILNGLAVKNNVRRNKVSVERSNTLLTQQKQDLERTIQQSYADAKGAIIAYAAAQKTTLARKQAYEYAQNRFSNGAATSLDFSQARQRYDAAVSAELQAKFDAIFKIKVLEFYFGIPLKL
ncbi:MAG: TolC family protein [Flavobacteriaceae bacterium]|nr:TolC family protein [Flavobacteriaceae bacterium]